MTGHTVVYTIGYHGRALTDVLDLLKKFDVQVLADIRANPYSRIPTYSRQRLQSAITESGIEYVHLGILGVPQEIRDTFKATRSTKAFVASYSAHLHSHQAALHDLSEHVHRKTYCLICLERDPRSILPSTHHL